MWLVRSGEKIFNIDICNKVSVENNCLILHFLNNEIEAIEFEFESYEQAKENFHHIIQALKRKDEVIYL